MRHAAIKVANVARYYPRINLSRFSYATRMMDSSVRDSSTLIIHKIECLDETGVNWWGSDEIALFVWGKTSAVIRKGNVDSGDSLAIEKRFDFEKQAHLFLIEEEPGSNQVLCLDKLEEAVVENATRFLSHHYRLHYSIKPKDPVPLSFFPSLTRARLIIKGLICIKDDELIAEEPRLKIKDGNGHVLIDKKFSLKTGEAAVLSDELDFTEMVEIELIESDLSATLPVANLDVDPHDALGGRSLGPVVAHNEMLEFGGRKARYRLIYDIAPVEVNACDPLPFYLIPKRYTTEDRRQMINLWVGNFYGPITQQVKWTVTEYGRPNDVIFAGTIEPSDWRVTQLGLQTNLTMLTKEIEFRESAVKGDQYVVRLSVKYGGYTFMQEGGFRTFPLQVPYGADNAFEVFLGSCYEYSHDQGRVERAYQKLYKDKIPHIKFLVGDLIYGDHPATDTVMKYLSAAEISIRLHLRYRNSLQSLRNLLAQGITLILPDDHEYTNGWPYIPLYMVRAVIDQLFDQETVYRYLEKWFEIAKKFVRLIENFKINEQSLRLTESFRIGSDLSFFVADLRSERKRDLETLLPEYEFKNLIRWVQELSCPGVLVISEPVLSVPNSDWFITFSEVNMAAYKQYRLLVNEIVKSKHDIVVLSGDVHFSRFAKVALRKHRKTLYEIVSSPLSLVEKTAEADNDPIEARAAAAWVIDKDDAPSVFPPTRLDMDTNTLFGKVRYLRAGARMQEFKTGKILKRTNENFARIRFFRASPEASKVTMHVESWLPRVGDRPELDWEYKVELS